MRGAWIEIAGRRPLLDLKPSLPVRGAWIEIEARIQCRHAAESLPVRGAWIEMTADAHGTPITLVAPRAGSVD